MKKSKKLFIVVFACFFALIMLIPERPTPNVVVADESELPRIPMRSLVSYALSWEWDPNIPYQRGGPWYEKDSEDKIISKPYNRWEDTLELNSATPNCGTDCSGFTSMVYKHFGINISMGTHLLYLDSIGEGTPCVAVYDVNDALPGDVCLWTEVKNGATDGTHAAIYLGNHQIIHTNTSSPPNNYIHLDEIHDDWDWKPSVYIRYAIDDGTSGEQYSRPDDDNPNVGKIANSLLQTENALTGMPIEFSLSDKQKGLALMSNSDLSTMSAVSVIELRDSINAGKMTWVDYLHVFTYFLGYLVLLYATLLLLAVLFDKVNNFVDFSFVHLLTFGKWQIIENDFDKTSNAKPGLVFLNMRGIVFRLILLYAVGLILSTGVIFRILLFFIKLFIK